MGRLFIAFFILLSNLSSRANNSDSIDVYIKAFEEQLQMLNGEKPADFTRAVFLAENAYYNGKLNYVDFTSEISSIGKKLKALIKQRGLENYKTAGNWAAFTYMTDTSSVNDRHPYTYDFNDFMGIKDWTNMFVTKLMRTKGGNCHSLPYFYKLLCKEIGANASLALAPNHVYIKHIDENGQWANVELTNGGFPRDQWIIKEMAISVEAIKNEVYMKPLTEKESVALCMFDLASGYEFQFGNDAFVLKVLDSALTYFPNCIAMLMAKSNCLQNMIETERKKKDSNAMYIMNKRMAYKEVINKIDALGHKDMPIEVYEDWVRSVEEEKIKRGSITK